MCSRMRADVADTVLLGLVSQEFPEQEDHTLADIQVTQALQEEMGLDYIKGLEIHK